MNSHMKRKIKHVHLKEGKNEKMKKFSEENYVSASLR